MYLSNNTEDFANQDKNSLNKSLKEECDKLGIKINFFKSVKEFIEPHSVKIDFTTYDWLSEKLDSDLVLYEINGRTRSSITAWFQRETGEESTGHIMQSACTHMMKRFICL